MTPKISLIIPIYNAQQYLQACLDSVAAQTVFADTQVLLVNDGSTDASPKICDDFAGRYANVQVLHRQNAGVSAARNAGLDAAAGDYVAFADADDLLLPEMLEKLHDAARQTGAQMTFCAFFQPYPDRPDVTIRYPFAENVLLDRTAIRTQIAEYMIRDEAMNALWNKLFRRDVLERASIRMTQGKKYAEDREFILRFLAVSDGACYVPYVGYYYRYVETGAIQKPRTDYAQRLTEQYHDDCRNFAALGVSETDFRRKGAVCWGGKIVGAVSFIYGKLTGKARTQTVRAFLNDPDLQDLLRGISGLQQGQTRFNRLILRAVQDKSRFRIHVLLLAMRVKVFCYNRMKGANRA